MAISTTTRAAFAAIALLASAVPASAEWKFCAPDGGHCKCFGEMRYGHPGLEEHLADDGKWFDSHPEVRRWNVRSVQGDAVACNAADFGDDPFPQIKNLKFCQCNLPEDAVWKPCAKGGEVCDCRPPSLASDANATRLSFAPRTPAARTTERRRSPRLSRAPTTTPARAASAWAPRKSPR